MWAGTGSWGIQFTGSLQQPKGPLLGSLQGNWLLLWTVHHVLMFWKHVQFHTYILLSVSPSALNLTEWLWRINGTAGDSMLFHLLVWWWRFKAIILTKILARARSIWGPVFSHDHHCFLPLSSIRANSLKYFLFFLPHILANCFLLFQFLVTLPHVQCAALSYLPRVSQVTLIWCLFPRVVFFLEGWGGGGVGGWGRVLSSSWLNLSVYNLFFCDQGWLLLKGMPGHVSW